MKFYREGILADRNAEIADKALFVVVDGRKPQYKE